MTRPEEVPPRPRVRQAEPRDADAVVELMYATAASIYDRFVGDERTAVRVLLRAYRSRGTNARTSNGLAVSWCPPRKDSACHSVKSLRCVVQVGQARSRVRMDCSASLCKAMSMGAIWVGS